MNQNDFNQELIRYKKWDCKDDPKLYKYDNLKLELR